MAEEKCNGLYDVISYINQHYIGVTGGGIYVFGGYAADKLQYLITDVDISQERFSIPGYRFEKDFFPSVGGYLTSIEPTRCGELDVIHVRRTTF